MQKFNQMFEEQLKVPIKLANLTESTVKLSISLPLFVKVADYHEIKTLAKVIQDLTGKKISSKELKMEGTGYRGVIFTGKPPTDEETARQKFKVFEI